MIVNFNASELISASGAFLVGLGAVITSLISLRSAKKTALDECDKRIHDIREAFARGTQYEPRESGVSSDLSDWGGR